MPAWSLYLISRWTLADDPFADDPLFVRLNIHLDEEDKVKDVHFG